IPPRLQQLVADGKLGKKSGQGFYTYRKGKAVKPKVSGKNWNVQEITDRMILRMLNETVSCLREQVVDNGDLLDAGMIFGTGFAPFRGGPVHHIEAQGREKLLQQLEALQKLRGDRFSPDAGWNTVFNDQGESSS
ncbi:MAG TPA: crotonase, partial [Gammaproteobacteria bacterium]|nr:crotonase [Gammaproteobacteria bacterium]